MSQQANLNEAEKNFWGDFFQWLELRAEYLRKREREAARARVASPGDQPITKKAKLDEPVK
jgi:hypothetical protein